MGKNLKTYKICRFLSTKFGGIMHDWQSKIERKKRKQSHTDGKQKGGTCQADYLKRYMAKSSRSYKHPDYTSWLERVREWNGGKKS